MRSGFRWGGLAAFSVGLLLAGPPRWSAVAAEPPVSHPASAATAPVPAGGGEGNRWSLPRLPWARSTPAGAAGRTFGGRADKAAADQKTVDGQVAIARLSERRGQTDQAEQLYRALLKKHPELVVPQHRLGVIEAKRGNFRAAEEHLRAALAAEPNNVELLNDAGYCYYLQNRMAEAQDLFQRALAFAPEHQGTCNNLALLLAEQGRFEESLVLFKRVNSEAEAHSNLAFMLTQLGELERAEAHYNYALTLDHTLRPAAHGMLQLADYQRTHKQPAPGAGEQPPAGTPLSEPAPVVRQSPAPVAAVAVRPPATNPHGVRLTSAETPVDAPRPAATAAPAPAPRDPAAAPAKGPVTPAGPNATAAPHVAEAAPAPPATNPAASADSRRPTGASTDLRLADGAPRSVPAAEDRTVRRPVAATNANRPSTPPITTRRNVVSTRLSDREDQPSPPPAAGGSPAATQTGLLNLNPHAHTTPLPAIPTLQPVRPESMSVPAASKTTNQTFPTAQPTWQSFPTPPSQR